MIQIGKIQKLEVKNLASIGAYLDGQTGNSDDNILLPNNQLPENTKEGDILEVFVYRDSHDRLIATMKRPLAQVGELAYLKVIEEASFGAFLDWGLEKDLFLPFSEQKYKVKNGQSYLVAIYVDKSGRLSATTNIDKYLSTDGEYIKDDWITGTVYMVREEIGAFVAVDDKYMGLIPSNEYFHNIEIGSRIEARVIRIREDGKLDLSPRKVAHEQMGSDAEMILQALETKGGFIPVNDKSEPEKIKEQLNMSKAAFKRAVGRLLKEGKITQENDGLRLK